tara:strand:+ start:155 stop:373 length:219 start_codon:yes stop_codon:yes gene_type:complete
LRKGRIQVEEYVERRLNIIHRDDICSAIYACLFVTDEMKNQILNVTEDNPERKKIFSIGWEKKSESHHTLVN